MSKTSLYFKTNVLLKNVIGKDLINDDNIAILELVKNSYDAGSKEVKIIFKNIRENDDVTIEKYSNKTSRIIIQDFGLGMSLDDIKNKWLNIAYSDKRNKRNVNGRIFAGSKGVGRFSCDRLGKYLNLYTRKAGGQLIHLKIDWTDFEIENRMDTTIQSIPVELNVIPDSQFEKLTGYKLFRNGTIIEIIKLRANWTTLEGTRKKYWDTSKLLSLRRNLEKLINPNQIFSKDKFILNLIANEFIDDDKSLNEKNKIVNGEINNTIFHKLNFTTTSIESSISDDGKTITTSLKDKDSEIFRLVEKNIDFPFLKSIKIVLYFLNQYSKIYFSRETGFNSIEFGSVFLFINGFRIPPYGDRNDDWLKMAVRQGQGMKRFLSARDIVGRIEVDDADGNFKIISSREGVAKDDTFMQLTSDEGYYYKTLKRIEKYVVEGLLWDSATNNEMSPEERQERSDYLKEFSKKVQSEKWKLNRKLELYGENDDVKNKRIIDLLYNIIGVKPENIIELNINPELLEQLMIEEYDKISQVFEDFRKYDPSILSKGTKNVLKKVEDLLRKKTVELEKANERYFNLSKDVSASNKKIESLNNEIKAKEDSLYIEKKKNKFLLATSKNTTPEVLGMIHHVELETTEIDNQVVLLMNQLKKNKFDEGSFLRGLTNIKFHSDKILKISKMINHSNFEADSVEQNEDLVGYIKEYLGLYSELVEAPAQRENVINISIEDHAKNFKYLFSFIDISIILDNLISNAKKAFAKNICFALNTKDSVLYLKVADDGIGIKDNLKDHIFDLGITNTKGSGIGLYTVRDLLSKMGAEIYFSGNNQLMSGAQFEIRFVK